MAQRADTNGGSSGGGGEGGGLRRLARSLFGQRNEAEAVEETASPVTAPSPAGEASEDGSKLLQQLTEWACEISDEDLRVEDLDPDKAIFDEGYVDSMSYVELLARIEERYGVAIPDDQVVGSTMRDLARYVADEMGA